MPILRRGGRPGLLGMAARTAVVAGTATAVSGAVAKHQQVRSAEQAALQSQSFAAPAPAPAAVPPVAPPAPGNPATDVVTKLMQLGELHQQGLLSAEEFAIAKQQLLGS